MSIDILLRLLQDATHLTFFRNPDNRRKALLIVKTRGKWYRVDILFKKDVKHFYVTDIYHAYDLLTSLPIKNFMLMEVE